MSTDLVWRAATLMDIPEITELAAGCDAAYGTFEVTLVDGLKDRLERDGDGIEEISRVVLDDGEVVGAAWIRSTGGSSENRYNLNVLTQPTHSSLYHGLVSWLVERRPMEAVWFDQTWRFERVTSPSCADLPLRDRELYAELDFERLYVEHELLRTPAPLVRAKPTQVELTNWSPDVHPAIRDAYNAAFAERDFSGYTEGGWDRVFRADLDDFKPNLSFVAADKTKIVGFVFATVFDDPDDWIDPAIRDLGWIDSIGVRSSHKGRGIATALISRALEAMRDVGVERVGLRVNDDNARALRLYEHVGFRPARKHIVYRRQVAGSSEQ